MGMISNSNHFCRRAYDLMVALPWKLTITQLLAQSSNNEIVTLLLSFALAIFASVILGHTGIKFIEIEQETRAHSTLHSTNTILRGNYMQIERISVIDKK